MTIDTSAWYSLFNEDSEGEEPLNPGGSDDMEVQNIMNADPEGFIPEDRFNACKDALKR